MMGLSASVRSLALGSVKHYAFPSELVEPFAFA